MSNSWLQVAQEALKVPGLLVEVYGDLAKPGVQQVGKALGTVFGLGNTVLWPIHWANERSRLYLERNLQDYRSRLENLPEEHIVEVAPEIGVPIAEKLSYVRDPRLADMYVTLLASASNVVTVASAHPSFVNVINNLSPDEAQLLEIFVADESIGCVTAKLVGDGKYGIAGELLVSPKYMNKLIFPQNVPAYLSNLAGLGIISIHNERVIHDSTVYPDLEAHWTTHFQSTLASYPDRKLEFERGTICTTKFGLQFIQACHSK
ncbi:DUF4393 domain-containing protein [Rheinheimera faecalis]